MKISLKTTLVAFLAFGCALSYTLAAENLIQKGNFPERSIQPWKVFSLGSTKKAEVKVQDGVLTLTTTYTTGKSTRRQLSQQLAGVKSESKYKLTFDAKASNLPALIKVTLSRSKDWERGHYGFSKEIDLKSEWKTYDFLFTTKKIDEGNHAMLKFLYGTLKGEVRFRNVKLVEVK